MKQRITFVGKPTIEKFSEFVQVMAIYEDYEQITEQSPNFEKLCYMCARIFSPGNWLHKVQSTSATVVEICTDCLDNLKELEQRYMIYE